MNVLLSPGQLAEITIFSINNIYFFLSHDFLCFLLNALFFCYYCIVHTKYLLHI